MYPATELLRTSFIKGVAKTTASVTVLGVVGLFYYLYNNVFDEKQDIYKKTKLDVKNLAKVFNKDNKKDNKKENVEISSKGEIKESSNTIETCDSAGVDNTDVEVNYIHDLDVFEKNVYEEKDNMNFKKLFDRL
jgi:hypothetical protein